MIVDERMPTDRRHAVIVCHPDPSSFNHAIAHTYRDAVRATGQGVVLRDLYAIGFDPVLTLWRNGVKLAMNDDSPTFNFYQSQLDAGIELFGLADGTYVATISAFPNFPLGNNISAGFTYDLQAPVPMATWCPPLSPGPVCRQDRHFSLHWTAQVE